MTEVEAAILGIVEGLTEFLPISSTGHLILAEKVLALEPSNFLSTFTVAVQLGAILAVMILYWKRLLIDMGMQKKILIAFMPTATVGFVLYKLIKTVLFENLAVVLAALLFGGVVLIWFEWRYRTQPRATTDLANITYRQSFLIGLAQSLSVIPGVSRAAATIIGGLGVGLDRRTIVEFSFLLAVPTMIAATGFDLWQNIAFFSADQVGLLLLGGFAAFAVAILTIRFFLRFISRHDFISFGIYRIFLAVLMWSLVL